MSPRIGILRKTVSHVMPPTLGGVVAREGEAERHRDEDDEPAVGNDTVARGDDNARRHRQLRTHAFEERCERRMTFHRIAPTTSVAMTMTAIG
jgi:hypothetical protein